MGRSRPGDQPAHSRDRFGPAERPDTNPAGTAAGPDWSGVDYLAISASEDFRDLRKRHRRFVFPMCALFFCWFMLYVLLAAYAHDFMGYAIVGHITVGLVFGLLQFASTAAITVLYLRFARKTMDPRVDAIRERARTDQSERVGATQI
ncbi:MAG: DUF485 domain-containing protein [Sciscionella sp.]